MAAETGFFRGAGGAVLEFTLPLGENLANQQLRGELRRINADGSDYVPDAEVAAVPGGPPAGNASKNAWVGYAVSLGVDVNDADAMTRNDLVEKFGKK